MVSLQVSVHADAVIKQKFVEITVYQSCVNILHNAYYLNYNIYSLLTKYVCRTNEKYKCIRDYRVMQNYLKEEEVSDAIVFLFVHDFIRRPSCS